MSAFLVVFSLFENSQLNFLHFQKIADADDGQKMAKAVMMVYGIDQIDQVVREAARRGNRSGFGQPSSCNSPRVAPGACHDPSPWRSASRLHSTVPAVTTQSGAWLIHSAPASQSCRT